MDGQENISEILEDLDDMFDAIGADLIKCIDRWVVFSKMAIIPDAQGELSKEMLLLFVTQQHEERYGKVFPFLQESPQGTLVSKLVIEAD